MPDQGSHDAREAQDLFTAFVSANDATNAAFEALCLANARYAAQLRAIKSRWDSIGSPDRHRGEAAALQDRLRAKFGESLDLGVSLCDDDTKSSGWQSKLVENLRQLRPSGARYRLLGEVARGGMGAILKIWDDDLRRALAMKVVLSPDDSPSGETPAVDPKTLGRFLEEAQITGQLEHPGIVPVHELGLDPSGRVYFTMRLVRGEDLRSVFTKVQRDQNEWSQVRALGVMLKVCEATAFAHSKGVIHRDLKPANVMVGKFGEVYVMDWGLARVLGREDKHDLRIPGERTPEASAVRTERSESREAFVGSSLITMDGDIVGTPNFMPPEQAKGQLSLLGAHSDVYSVGAMLYQLVTGEMPYTLHDESASPIAVLESVMAGPPKPVLTLAPRTPAELIAIIEKAMAREVSERYASMLALADDLRAYLEGRVVRAHETGAWAETRKWVQRNKPLAAAIAGSVVVAIVGAVAFAAKAREATNNAEAEKRARAESDRNASVAQQKIADVLSLSAQKDLEDLVARAESLWPAYPEMIPKYEDWLAQANELIGGRPADPAKGIKKRPSLAEHEAKLAELRANAKPRTEHRPQDASRSFDYVDSDAAWWDRQLSKLVSDLEALQDPRTGLMSDVFAEPFGWSVMKRYEFAKTIEERSLKGADAQRRWDEALAAIRASPKYGGLALTPQLGLLPIGADPDSRLWEFAHLQTGEPAIRGADGKLVLSEATGLVFVLIPGAKFVMGSQRDDLSAPNYDPQSVDDETPAHEVELAAYFLSKYEMTQGQWQRICARNPSMYQPPSVYAPTLLHAVEQVSWLDCQLLAERLALSIPSEAQWEHGARAETDTPWWTGAERESLRGKVNLADQSAKKKGNTWGDIEDWPDLEDGCVVHSEVGHYAANAFGLHEVAGNLMECCLDGYDRAFYGGSPSVDPVAPWTDSDYRVIRGGSFFQSASNARSARRNLVSPEFRGDAIGFRPARHVAP